MVIPGAMVYDWEYDSGDQLGSVLTMTIGLIDGKNVTPHHTQQRSRSLRCKHPKHTPANCFGTPLGPIRRPY